MKNELTTGKCVCVCACVWIIDMIYVCLCRTFTDARSILSLACGLIRILWCSHWMHHIQLRCWMDDFGFARIHIQHIYFISGIRNIFFKFFPLQKSSSRRKLRSAHRSHSAHSTHTHTVDTTTATNSKFSMEKFNLVLNRFLYDGRDGRNDFVLFIRYTPT